MIAWIIVFIVTNILSMLVGMALYYKWIDDEFGEDWQCVLKKENGDCECDKCE